jgi:hypothetical protein
VLVGLPPFSVEGLTTGSLHLNFERTHQHRHSGHVGLLLETEVVPTASVFSDSGSARLKGHRTAARRSQILGPGHCELRRANVLDAST